MKSPNVIAIGEALIDRLGPPGGDPSIDKPVSDCFGGAPANVACALSRLGANVAFIGAIGNDGFGQKFKNLMIHRGINITGLQQDNSRPTRIVLVKRDANGERTFGGFQGDQGLGFADQAILRTRIIKKWPLLADQTKWLIVGTIPLASEISSEAFLWCVDKAVNSGIKIAMDLNWRPIFWRKQFSSSGVPLLKEKQAINSILKHVSLLKLAKEEAEWFFHSSNPLEISSNFSHRPSVIVTDGSNPVSWLLNNKSGNSRAISSISVIDTTGAGDAFTAGLIYRLLPFELDQISKQIAEEIIEFAVACGAYVCQGVGAIDSQPSLNDVQKLLSANKGGIN